MKKPTRNVLHMTKACAYQLSMRIFYLLEVALYTINRAKTEQTSIPKNVSIPSYHATCITKQEPQIAAQTAASGLNSGWLIHSERATIQKVDFEAAASVSGLRASSGLRPCMINN